MEMVLVFLLIPLIFISGCATQVQTTGKLTEEVSIEEEVTEEVTKGTTPTVQPKVEEKVEIVTPAGNETKEPKIFKIDVVQGVGIKEGTG